MLTKYECWETDSGYMFGDAAGVASAHADPALQLLQKLFEFEAATYEEAASIYNLRMGHGPCIPMGEAEPCPQCSAWFYPRGSGQCWRCGPVC